MSYSSVVKKNMAATYGGKSSNSTYIVQKASGSAYGPATSAINGNASKHSSLQYSNKYSMKVNSHLLDHGYGAMPQPSYETAATTTTAATATSTRLASDDSNHFKSFTNTIDAGITKYYKVSLLMCMEWPCSDRQVLFGRFVLAVAAKLYLYSVFFGCKNEINLNKFGIYTLTRTDDDVL